MVFGFGNLYFMVREALDEPGPNMLCAGTAAGMALLTKPEFGGASYLALAAVVLMRSLGAGSLSRLWDALLALIPGVLINVAVYGWFFRRLSAAFILKKNFPSYFMLTYGPRFLAINGFRFAVWEIVGLTIGACFSFLAWYMVAAAANSKAALRSLLVVVYLALALLSLPHRPWIQQIMLEAGRSIVFPRGMYWFGIFALCAAIVGLLRGDSRKIAVGVVAVYALATGLRVLAQVVPSGYSIFYDGGLFSLFIMLVTGCDRDLNRDAPAPRRFRATSVLLFLEGAWICGILLFIVLLAASASYVPLVTPIGTIYTTHAAAGQFPRIMAFIRDQSAHGKRVLILPEAPLLYALTRTEAATRWYEIVPGILSPDDQREFIRVLGIRNVDYILLSNRPTFEYGVPYFGEDYCQLVYLDQQTVPRSGGVWRF
jgi:hypothetical protein